METSNLGFKKTIQLTQTSALRFARIQQLDNNPARRNAIDLFCYDIDIFDFSPNKYIKDFTNIRSMIKSCRWLGYTIYQTAEMLQGSKMLDGNLYIIENRADSDTRKTSEELRPVVEFLALCFGVDKPNTILIRAGLKPNN